MDNALIGYFATAVLFGFIFGWKGILAVALFGICAIGHSRGKHSNLVLWMMKLGDNSHDDK